MVESICIRPFTVEKTCEINLCDVPTMECPIKIMDDVNKRLMKLELTYSGHFHDGAFVKTSTPLNKRT